ncbi:MAG: GAF domain-containing protein [Chloroflexi bacterium]|nr:GAF domain-containing protein [Chloroflexota bacterium]
METREARYYRALYQVAVTINSTLDTRAVLKAVAESTAGALQAKACSIILLSPDRRELYHSAAYGLSDWYVRKGPLSVDASMSEALSGRSVVVLDVSTDPRVQYRPQAIREGIASVLSAPIRLRDHVIGVVRVYTAERRQFSPEDIEFVEAVANLGAIALENAHRYEEVKADYDAVHQDLLEWYATWGLERSADALAGGVVQPSD